MNPRLPTDRQVAEHFPGRGRWCTKCGPSSQVNRSFISNTVVAEHRGEAPSAAVERARMDWKARARQWLGKRGFSEVEDTALHTVRDAEHGGVDLVSGITTR